MDVSGHKMRKFSDSSTRNVCSLQTLVINIMLIRCPVDEDVKNWDLLGGLRGSPVYCAELCAKDPQCKRWSYTDLQANGRVACYGSSTGGGLAVPTAGKKFHVFHRLN